MTAWQTAPQPATRPLVRYIGATWNFPYTYTQTLTDGTTAPVDLTGSVMTGSLVAAVNNAGIAMLQVVEDGDTDLQAGRFKFRCQSGELTLPVPPVPSNGIISATSSFVMLKLIIVQVDSLGDTNFLGVQHIQAVLP